MQAEGLLAAHPLKIKLRPHPPPLRPIRSRQQGFGVGVEGVRGRGRRRRRRHLRRKQKGMRRRRRVVLPPTGSQAVPGSKEPCRSGRLRRGGGRGRGGTEGGVGLEGRRLPSAGLGEPARGAKGSLSHLREDHRGTKNKHTISPAGPREHRSWDPRRNEAGVGHLLQTGARHRVIGQGDRDVEGGQEGPRSGRRVRRHEEREVRQERLNRKGSDGGVFEAPTGRPQTQSRPAEHTRT